MKNKNRLITVLAVAICFTSILLLFFFGGLSDTSRTVISTTLFFCVGFAVFYYIVKRNYSDSLQYMKQQLNFARTVGKRLDEHRELVESIEKNTDLFQRFPWHINHAATQDDYLLRLYFLVHGEWPCEQRRSQLNGEHVRQRPKVLGEVSLPEYPTKQAI